MADTPIFYTHIHTHTYTHSLDVSVLFSEALVSPGLLPASTVDRQSHQVNIHVTKRCIYMYTVHNMHD